MGESFNIKFNESFHKKTDPANWVNIMSDVAKDSGLELEKELARAKFKKPTGNLMRGHQAIHKGLTTQIRNPVKYWPYVNYGTGPHTITPKRKKALYWKGASHPVPMVRHPGITGTRFVTKAVHKFTNSNKLHQILKRELRRHGVKT